LNNFANHSEFKQAFNAIDELLELYQLLWRYQPFIQPDCPWRLKYPSLHIALLQLSKEQVNIFEKDIPIFIDWLAEFVPDLSKAIIALNSVALIEPAQTLADEQPCDKFTHVGVPGRKWQQIKAFIEQLTKPQSDIIDWCSGKGYLATALHDWAGKKVTCLELNESLCRAGQKNALAKRTNVEFIQADLLKTIPPQCQEPTLLHTGLHACGDLHISFLHQTAGNLTTQIALSPCCYHKIKSDFYVPLSITAKSTKLKLNRLDLHLATEEVVTGGQRVVRQRHTERLWRLAFNSLYQQHYESEQYLALPSCPKSLMAKSFYDFCIWAREKKSLHKITDESIQIKKTDQHLIKAKTRLLQVSQLELVRKVFNKPFEHWLILDRALFLCEHDYLVTLREFCPKAVTPRNILISAKHLKNNLI
jgi:hypothetical protein